MRRCKACHREMNAKWRAENPDYMREWYLANRPEPTRKIVQVINGRKECTACGVVQPLESFHRQASGPGGRRTVCKSCRKRAHRDNPEPARQSAKRRRERRPNYMAEWRAANPDLIAAAHFRRQSRLKGQSWGFTNDYIAKLLAALKAQPCAYCGGPGGEVDHIVPVARGGLHHPQNFVPACRLCNVKKNDKLLEEWAERPPLQPHFFTTYPW